MQCYSIASHDNKSPLVIRCVEVPLQQAHKPYGATFLHVTQAIRHTAAHSNTHSNICHNVLVTPHVGVKYITGVTNNTSSHPALAHSQQL